MATQTVKTTALSLLILLGAGGAALADRNCTKEEAAQADRQLWLNGRDRQVALKRHAPWGVPEREGSGPRLLVQRDYIIGYDDSLKVPLWTAHRLDTARFVEIERINCFREDPRIPPAAASTPKDYDDPIFDQGHLVPNGDMKLSLTAVVNSFVQSNMTPQYCQFNRGVWQILESMVRLWAEDYGTLYVVTGSIFDRDRDGQPDADEAARRMVPRKGPARVAVPTHQYKILLWQGEDGALDALAFVLANDQTDVSGTAAQAHIAAGLRSIADVEVLTGFTLFRSPQPGFAPITGGVRTARPHDLWEHSGKLNSTGFTAQCRTIRDDP